VRYQYIAFYFSGKVKQFFIADQAEIDWLELKGSFVETSRGKENTMNRSHVNLATRHNARLSRRKECLEAYTFIYSAPSRTSLTRICAHPHDFRGQLHRALSNLSKSSCVTISPWILKRYRHTCGVCASRWQIDSCGRKNPWIRHGRTVIRHWSTVKSICSQIIR